MLKVKSNCESKRSRSAENPNSERWRTGLLHRDHGRKDLGVGKALITQRPLHQRVERMACACERRSGRAEEEESAWESVTGVVVMVSIGASPPFPVLEFLPWFRLLVRSSIVTPHQGTVIAHSSELSIEEYRSAAPVPQPPCAAIKAPCHSRCSAPRPSGGLAAAVRARECCHLFVAAA